MSFYTYMWLREDGTPYYIGKGQGNRAFKSGGRRQTFSAPPQERIIIQEYETEEEAFDAEKLLIAYYGRKDNETGILRNLSDGGEGPSGQVTSEELRRLRSERVRGAFNPMKRANVAIRNGQLRKGLKRTEETRKQLSKTFRDLWESGKHAPSPTSFQKGNIPWNKGKTYTRGTPSWNSGKKLNAVAA